MLALLLGQWRQICQTAQKIVRALTQQGYFHRWNMPRKRHAQPVTGTGKAAPANRAKRPLPQASPLPKPARGYMGWLHAKAKARRLEQCLLDGPAAQGLAVNNALRQGRGRGNFVCCKSAGMWRRRCESLGIQPKGRGIFPRRGKRTKCSLPAVAKCSPPAVELWSASVVHAYLKLCSPRT